MKIKAVPKGAAFFCIDFMVNFVLPVKLWIMVQETGNRLYLAIQKQTERIEYFCTVENISPNLIIHELRKSFKRLRALLLFYVETSNEEIQNSNAEIRIFGKLLAPLRESFVNAELFEREILANTLVSEKKTREAKDRLFAKNKELVDRGFFENNLQQVIRSFFDKSNFQLILKKAPFPSKILIMKQISSSYLKGYSIFEQLEAYEDAEKLHELRRKLKQLWYQIDFVKFLHPRYFKLKSDQLNKITEQQGDDHDLFIFAEELKSGEYGFDPEELEILENQIQHLREINLLKLEPRLKQFFKESPQEFNIKLEEIFKVV